MIQYTFYINLINDRLHAIVVNANKLNRQQKNINQDGAKAMLYWYNVITPRQIYEQLEALREIFNKLHHSHILINEYFGNSMLGISIYIFLMESNCCYWSIFTPSETELTLYPMDLIIQFSNTTMLFIIICQTCEENSKTVGRMLCVCGIIQSKFIIQTEKISLVLNDFTHNEYSLQTKEFSLQIMDQKFIYTANRFFDVNLQLFYSVMNWFPH